MLWPVFSMDFTSSTSSHSHPHPILSFYLYLLHHLLILHHLPDLYLPSHPGLGCQRNHTLSFAAVDSLRHRRLAERLGINLTSPEPHNTAVVILDTQREAHFIMDAPLSKAALAAFVLNYTSGSLDR